MIFLIIFACYPRHATSATIKTLWREIMLGWIAFFTYTGFGLRIAADCEINKEIFLQERETINLYSPGFENHGYPINAFCSWTIKSNSFRLVSIWPSYKCVFDGINLYDGASTAAPILGQFCVGTPSLPVITTGSQLHIVFYSSDLPSKPFAGFHLKIRHLEPERICSEHELKCQNKKCVKKKFICDQKDDCGDGTDEENCGYRVRASCGLAAPDVGNGDRIVGGKAALEGSWPWQCSLRWKADPLYGHLCGAVLIHAQWIVTAAHCFRDHNNASFWTVHIGKFYKEKFEKSEQVRYIKEIIIHPKYTKTNPIQVNKKDNDIALVKMNAPVTMTPSVRPVCLPPWMATINPGTVCHVTGWGETRGTGNAGVLKQAAVPITSEETCQKAYNLIQIAKSMICAGYANGGHDSCKGDSGGPLVLQKMNRWYLIGVVSTGGNCAMANQPGIYTRVSFYKPWIADILWNH